LTDTTPDQPVSTGPAAVSAGHRPDPRALLALVYRDHGGAVYGLAGYLCGAEQAEEATRRVFVAWWRNGGRIDPSPVAMRTMLLTMVGEVAPELVSTHRARNLPTEVCAQGTDHLSGHERDAIATAVLGQCSYRDAAAILGRPAEAVRSGIRAGLRRLHPGSGAALSRR
jgi:DNA-directed RNA polymerase specialized sigma24 family protein